MNDENISDCNLAGDFTFEEGYASSSASNTDIYRLYLSNNQSIEVILKLFLVMSPPYYKYSRLTEDEYYEHEMDSEK